MRAGDAGEDAADDDDEADDDATAAVDSDVDAECFDAAALAFERKDAHSSFTLDCAAGGGAERVDADSAAAYAAMAGATSVATMRS